MNIHCYYPVKKMDKYYLAAIKEYSKRLGRYCKIKFHYLPQDSLPPAGEIIYISSGHPEPAMPSSEEFADFIAGSALHGQSELHFVLTDSPQGKGFSLSHAPLSASLLTVLLAEQIYRAYRIIHNHSYHK